MQSKAILGLQEATRLLAAARAEAQANGWAVSIAVVDDGGHLLALERLDGASPSSAYVAEGKARTAAVTRKESKVFEDSINGGRTAMLSNDRLLGMEGGVPVVHEGQVIGAVGVSGVRSDQDAQVAKAGVASLA